MYVYTYSYMKNFLPSIKKCSLKKENNDSINEVLNQIETIQNNIFIF